MTTKTITISEEAYTLLKYAKEGKESFTETIIKIAKKDPLSKLAGVLSKEEASDLRRHIAVSREKTEKRLQEIRNKLK
ncbi:MAG: antitoxin VapB family protein [Nanoarchaeota archaeon]